MVNIRIETRSAEEIEKQRRAKHNFRTPDSHYFNKWQDIPKEYYTKHSLAFSKRTPFIRRNAYNYPENTPFLTNLEIKTKWFSKTTLSKAEITELNFALEKRRHLMDSFHKYDFTRVYHRFITHLEWRRCFDHDQNRAEEWFKWLYKVWKWRKKSWEDKKEKWGYYSQIEMLELSDYTSIRKDMRLNERYERTIKWNRDRISGAYIYRTMPLDIHVLEGKVYQGPLKHFMQQQIWVSRENKASARKPMWNYHDPYKHMINYIFPQREFMHDYRRHQHLYLVQAEIFYHKNVLYSLDEFKKIWRHQKKVHDSWDYILDKNVGLKDKISRFWKGELWLQSKGSILDIFNITWGSASVQDNEDALAASKFNMFGEHSKESENEYKGALLAYNYLDCWNWANPGLYGNWCFLNFYWDPWLAKMKKYKKNIKGTKAEPDIFWFKFSHCERFYLKRADKSAINHRDLDSGAHLRYFYRYVYRIWYNAAAVEKDMKKRDQKFYIRIGNSPLKARRLPADQFPDYDNIKMYEYVGPNFWYNTYQNFPGLASSFFGPRNFPTEFRYETFCQDHAFNYGNHILNSIWIQGISWKWVLYLNPIFVVIFFILCIIVYSLFFFFSVKGPWRVVRWSFGLKEPVWVTRKWHDRDEYLTQIEEWRYIPDAKHRHDFNWWIIIQLIPFVTFAVFLPYWFLKLRFYWIGNVINWVIFLGSYSFICLLRICCSLSLEAFSDWLETKITPEQYALLIKQERYLTWIAERRYKHRLAVRQKAYGVTYNSADINYRMFPNKDEK